MASPFPETATVSRAERAEQATSGPGRNFGADFDLGNLSRGEWWLNKLGIGLLLFGVAFLFMFSVERGWITPPMRVGFGLAIGATLLALGLRVYEDRRAFSQVLLGGGIGTLYITGFAAFQLYELVSYLPALAFMVAVTLMAYFLSLRQDEAPLSVIGALGGLGTPFLLYSEAGTLGGLVLYTCLILAGMTGVYFYKGWVSLLAVSSAGGWLVFLVGYLSSFSLWEEPSSADRWTLQLGVIFAWLLFWLVPVTREVLYGSGRAPAHVYLYAVSAPIILLGFTDAIWHLPSSDFGWITFSGATLYALAALALRRLERGDLSYVHTLVTLLLLTHTLVLVLDGSVLLLTLAAEATVLHYVARKFSDRIVATGAHLLFSIAALWLAARLLPGILGPILAGLGESGRVGTPVLSVDAITDLATILLVALASLVVRPDGIAPVYRVGAHVALLAFLWRELSVLSGGDAFVTISWGAYAAGLLVWGLRKDRAGFIRVGLMTLFLVVGKLFLVDLAEVGAIWRVLLFLGFGGLFLALSYYLRSLWRPASGEGPIRDSDAARDRS